MSRLASALFFILILAPRVSTAQPVEQAVRQCFRKASGTSYAGNVEGRLCFYNLVHSADTALVKAAVAELEREAERRDNPYFRLYARYNYVYSVIGTGPSWPIGAMINGLKDLVADAERLGDAPHLAWAECMLADGYFSTMQQYDLGFETGLRVQERLRQLSEEEVPDRADLLGTIANFYYYFGEYRQAIGILTEAVGTRASPASSMVQALGRRRCYNTLGLCYRQLRRFDSSDYCFRQGLLEAAVVGDPAWTSIIQGNLGINLYRQGHFAEAVPLLRQDVRASAARTDFDNAAGSILPLADIALKSGRLEDAAATLDSARHYIAIYSAVARLPLYHSLRARLAAARGDAAAVAAHTDSLAAIKDSLAHRFSTLHLARAEQRLQSARMRAKLAAASAQRNALVIILLLAGGVTTFGFLYFRRRRIEAQQRAAAESARAAAELRAREAELRVKDAELETAAAALERFRHDVQEKATLIEQLSAQLDEDEHGAVLQQLREATILTDAQWVEFRRMFEKVHAGFIERLGQQYAGLTAGEVRFLVLARLGFSNKEMAGALGVSTNSVRVTWHRLRRKLGLDEEVQVGQVVEGI